MKKDLIYLIRRTAKYNSNPVLYVFYSFEELNCKVACQGSGLFLHTFIYDPPTPNRVEATPTMVKASNKAWSLNKDLRHYTLFIDS